MRSTAHLLSQIPLMRAFRQFGFPRRLPVNYTFLISTVCNSRCLTCNIWKQKHDHLKMDEWKKVLRSIGTSPYWVTVSGGEPFLQPHLPDLVIAIDRICQPAIINIPTNSLLVDRIYEYVSHMLKHIKTPQLIINLSLDGIGPEHDRVRGIPGNFNRVMKNYENLKKLQKKHKNLVIGFGTVVSNHNINSVRHVFDHVFKLAPDQYLSEIAEERVELDTVGLPITPGFRAYAKVIDHMIHLMESHRFSGIGRVSRAFRFQYYQFVKDWLRRKKLLPDYAGFASVEITSWGEVWPSCIKGENMGNVRDVNYDFKKVWFSKAADQIRSQIKKRGTSYPLANAFYTSSLHHIPTMMKVLLRMIK